MFARIQDDIVVELIEDFADEDGVAVPLDERFAPEICAACVQVPEGMAVAYGWSYRDGQFAGPPLLTGVGAAPRVVTMRQARLALLGAGKLEAVDQAIAALPVDRRKAAQIEWEFAATVERDSGFVQLLSTAMALDDAALDDLFTKAAAL